MINKKTEYKKYGVFYDDTHDSAVPKLSKEEEKIFIKSFKDGKAKVIKKSIKHGNNYVYIPVFTQGDDEKKYMKFNDEGFKYRVLRPVNIVRYIPENISPKGVVNLGRSKYVSMNELDQYPEFYIQYHSKNGYGYAPLFGYETKVERNCFNENVKNFILTMNNVNFGEKDTNNNDTFSLYLYYSEVPEKRDLCYLNKKLSSKFQLDLLCEEWDKKQPKMKRIKKILEGDSFLRGLLTRRGEYVCTLAFNTVKEFKMVFKALTKICKFPENAVNDLKNNFKNFDLDIDSIEQKTRLGFLEELSQQAETKNYLINRKIKL